MFFTELVRTEPIFRTDVVLAALSSFLLNQGFILNLFLLNCGFFTDLVRAQLVFRSTDLVLTVLNSFLLNRVFLLNLFLLT
jgi:hypothetical protein